MTDSTKEPQQTSPSDPPFSAQDAAVQEVEEAMTRLRICPRNVLGSLEHLRIEKARIKPLEDKAPKAGGKADMEPAVLVPAQSSNTLGTKDTEYVAVKKLRFDTDADDDQALAPIAHEVKLLNGLSHPSVVKIVGFVEDVEQGIAWMVYSWEKNGNLREFVRSANWELPERVSLMHDVAEGLGYLHGRDPPICHGDLKSLNVLVNYNNRAVITDLGSACTAITGNFPFDEEKDPAIILRAIRGDLPAVGDNVQLKQVKALCSLMGQCWRLNANERPTAIICQQEISFMNQVMPSSSKVSGSGATRSSRLLFALGSSQLQNEVASEAEKYLQESLVVAKSVGDKQGSARASYALGEVYQMRSEYAKAQELYTQARDTYSQIGNKQGFANSVNCLGEVYNMQSESSKAQESYVQARDILSQIGDQEGFANSVKGLGDVYRIQCKYSKAEELYIQARDIFSQIGNQLGFANVVCRLGDVSYMRDELSKAQELYIQAHDIFSEIGNQQGFAKSVKGLGDVYRMQRKYPKAEESYIQARETFSRIGSQLGFANSVKGLGEVYRMQSEYSKAEEFYIQARDTYSQIGDQIGFANCVQGLGRAYSASGEYTEAEKSYMEAQAVYRQIGHDQSVANNLWYLGWLRRSQAQYGEAERFVREASVLYDKLGLKVYVERCDKFLAKVLQLMSA